MSWKRTFLQILSKAFQALINRREIAYNWWGANLIDELCVMNMDALLWTYGCWKWRFSVTDKNSTTSWLYVMIEQRFELLNREIELTCVWDFVLILHADCGLIKDCLRKRETRDILHMSVETWNCFCIIFCYNMLFSKMHIFFNINLNWVKQPWVKAKVPIYAW